MAMIPEEFVILCDDDFIFDARTRFDEAAFILKNCPEIAVVGGKLIDYDEESQTEYTRHWELFLQYDPINRLLVSLPIRYFAPRVRELGGLRFFLCDAVMNFALFRRSIFDGDVSWDEQFKSNGEHEDFYLNLKLNTSWKTAYLSTMMAYHHHPLSYVSYRHQLRDRVDGWRKFFDKWSIDQHIEIGLGVRTRENLSETVSAADAEWRFFFNADGSLTQTVPEPDRLDVRGAGAIISPVGSLDERGDRDLERTRGSLLINRVTNRVIAGAPERVTPDDDDRAPADRYALEASPGLSQNDSELGSITFRYNPVVNPQCDSILWYSRASDRASQQSSQPRHLSVFFRWRATGSGRMLVWRSASRVLDLTTPNSWEPLLIELPVPPREGGPLRLDVLAEMRDGEALIATGFFVLPAMDMRSIEPPRARDVQMMGRHWGVGDEVPSLLLSSADAATSSQSIAAEYVDGGLLLIDLAGIDGPLFVSDWAGASEGHLRISRHPEESGVPATLALPLTHAGSCQLHHYMPGMGLQRLVLQTKDAAIGGVGLTGRH